MRATLMYNAGDIRVEDVPEPTIQEPTDAIIRVTYACVCGSGNGTRLAQSCDSRCALRYAISAVLPASLIAASYASRDAASRPSRRSNLARAA